MVLKGTFNFGRFAVVIVNHTKREQSRDIYFSRIFVSTLLQTFPFSRFKKTCISFGSINSTPVRSFSVVILEENKVIKPAHTTASLNPCPNVPHFTFVQHLSISSRFGCSYFTLP